MRCVLTSLAVVTWMVVAAEAVVDQSMELAEKKVRSAELKLTATDEPGTRGPSARTRQRQAEALSRQFTAP